MVFFNSNNQLVSFGSECSNHSGVGKIHSFCNFWSLILSFDIFLTPCPGVSPLHILSFPRCDPISGIKRVLHIHWLSWSSDYEAEVPILFTVQSYLDRELQKHVILLAKSGAALEIAFITVLNSKVTPRRYQSLITLWSNTTS